MNIAQLSEQLKDVPQNRLIDYARNPNSVVPQFLALAEIQRRQQLSAQVAPPAATVAEDVLAQAQPAPQMVNPQITQMAQQLPENQPGVSQLHSGMGQGFAPGGLVAFAGGGLNLDDDETPETEDQELSRIFPTDFGGLRSIGKGIESLMAMLPASYEKTKAKYEGTPSVDTTSKHKYAGMVSEEAKRQGREGQIGIFLHALNKETGGMENPEKARSKAGAMGIAQFMPRTAKSLNIDPDDPKQASYGLVKHLGNLLDKYQDPKLALMAYNWGEGNVNKWLRSGANQSAVPKETRGYIAGLSGYAHGGKVQHFAGEGPSLVGPEGEPIEDFLEKNPRKAAPEKVLTEAEKARARDFAQAEENLRKNAARAAEMKGAPKAAPAAAAPATESIGTIGRLNKLIGAYLVPSAVYEGGKYATQGAMSQIARPEMSATREALMHDIGADHAFASGIMQNADYSKPESNWSKYIRNLLTSEPSPVAPQAKPTAAPAAPASTSSASATPEAPKAPVTPAQQSAYDKYFEMAAKQIEETAANLAQQGKMNAALSVLSAGLGMLKSKSPYFLQGIGEGGEQGVGTYAALGKQQSEGLKDLMAARLGLAKYGAAAEASQRAFGLKSVDIARDNLQNWMARKQAELKARFPMGEMTKGYAQALADIYRDPQYIQLAKDAQLPYAEASSAPSGPRSKSLGSFQQ